MVVLRVRKKPTPEIIEQLKELKKQNKKLLVDLKKIEGNDKILEKDLDILYEVLRQLDDKGFNLQKAKKKPIFGVSPHLQSSSYITFIIKHLHDSLEILEESCEKRAIRYIETILIPGIDKDLSILENFAKEIPRKLNKKKLVRIIRVKIKLMRKIFNKIMKIAAHIHKLPGYVFPEHIKDKLKLFE